MISHSRRLGCGVALALSLSALIVLNCNATAAEKPSGGKHFLWRVGGGSAPFYLLGSIHALRASDYPKTPVIEQAIKESQQFFVEVDPKQDELFTKKLIAAAEYPRGVQIKGKIRPETYKYLLKITITGAGLWQHLHPWAIAVFLLRHPGFEGVSYAYGMDNYIEETARRTRRPVYGLETADEHVHVLSDMQDVEGEVMLLQSLVYGDEGPKRFRQDVAAWNAGDTQAIWLAELPRIKEAPTIYWRLLERRNKKWIPKIESAIKSGKPTMVVAGALHFCGPNSVIAMLRARGYKVEQL